MLRGKVAGLIVGASISFVFILPADVLLNLQLASMPIDDLLRVFGAVIVVVIAVGIGHFIE